MLITFAYHMWICDYANNTEISTLDLIDLYISFNYSDNSDIKYLKKICYWLNEYHLEQKRIYYQFFISSKIRFYNVTTKFPCTKCQLIDIPRCLNVILCIVVKIKFERGKKYLKKEEEGINKKRVKNFLK